MEFIWKTSNLNRSTKGAMTGSFRRAHYQVSKNEMLKQIGIITNESYQ